MKKNRFSMKAWERRIAALAALAGLALAPAPAQADICGDLDDIGRDMRSFYFDQFEALVGLSEKTCDSMTSTFAKACASAVKDAVKCWDRQNSTIPKAAKPACSEASKNPSACNDGFETAADISHAQLAADANSAYEDCASAANAFWDFCRFGP